MLRALLFGLLTVFATTSCSKKADAPAVAVGAAAGKVVEITGTVHATREGKTRELAMGGEVFRDDQIATSEAATVTIELFHNGAKWAVVSNKTARVDSSLAWGLDKQEASKTVEHNSAAAGRNAERSAADTGATTTQAQAQTESAPGAAAPVAPPVGGGTKAEPPPAPPPPPPPPKTSTRGKGAPAPRNMAAKDLAQAPTSTSESAGSKEADGDVADEEKAAVVISPQTLAERQRPALQKCLAKATNVTIKINVRKNKTTTTSKGTNLTDKERACIDGVIQKIEWPVPGTTFEVSLKL